MLGETIFCRQVDMLTYVDYSEQESITGSSMPEVVDDAGLDDSDQIRTLSSPSEDLPSHQQPVRVSTGASGKIVESPDEEQLAMPKTKGVYILGYVEGVGCPICVDTGCTKTTISERLYYRIPRERRPKLLPAPKMSMAARGASVQPWVGLGFIYSLVHGLEVDL